MRKTTSGLRLGICLGVILLVFAGGTTTASNLPEEKLLRLVKRSDNLESSTFVLTGSTVAKQDEKEKEERKTNDFGLSNSGEANKEEKEGEEEEEGEEEDEDEIETTTIISTTMAIKSTNRDIANISEIVTTMPDSTTTSSLLNNELEMLDRTGKRDNASTVDVKQNVSLHIKESETSDSTTKVSVATTTSIPITTLLSSFPSDNTEKRPETSEDSSIPMTTIGDTSIYENTIDRKDSEKKPIVTEPSVVLENSIQQSGSSQKLGNGTSESTSESTIESTSSVFSTGTTESSSIEISTEGSIGILTSGTPFSYVPSENEDPSEKPDFTSNGITENSSPIIGTQMTIHFAPSASAISEPKTKAPSTDNETVTSDDYYATVSTSDANFVTETTIESSDLVGSTSIEPTSSFSSTSSSSAVEYEFIGLTESSTDTSSTISSTPIENASTTRDLTRDTDNGNASDSFPTTRSFSETAAWPRMVTERTVPVTHLSVTTISTSVTTSSTTNTTNNSTESTIVATTVKTTTERLEPTPIVNVVTLDIPSSTVATTIHNDKMPTGRKGPDSTATTTTEAPPSDDVTSFVRIILEGTWHFVCPRLEDFRQSLATFLSNGLGKIVSIKQIRFHRNPCNGPPTDETLFSIFVYIVDENGKFDAAMTKNLPNLYKSIALDSPIAVHSILLVQETDSSNAIAVIVVSSVAFICLLLLAGLLFVMRKRQTRFNYGERCRPVSLDAYSLDSVSAYNSVRRKGVTRSSKRSYGNPAFEDSSAIPSHPLNFAGLSTFSNDVDAINEEFSSIPQVSAKMDELPPGAEVKNRYANVIPLPESRVPLRKLNDDPLSEYINANYVRGPKNATKYYIACQAPLDTTVTDFWRMIWEQQCKVVIMLTDLVENGVEKCTEYIPPSEVTDCHRLYGDFQVTLKKRETKEKYAISTLHLKNLENNTFREVYHIWYLWPATGPQSDGAGLIAVLLEARALQRGGPGPIVVHCSPGTGRTGTLIALDLGIRQYEITRTVDVPRVVYTIRRDRAGAVQTKEQYAFIYKALNLYATKLAGGMLEST